MKSFESVSLVKNESDAISAASKMLKEEGIFTEFPVYREISQDGAVVL